MAKKASSVVARRPNSGGKATTAVPTPAATPIARPTRAVPPGSRPVPPPVAKAGKGKPAKAKSRQRPPRSAAARTGIVPPRIQEAADTTAPTATATHPFTIGDRYTFHISVEPNTGKAIISGRVIAVHAHEIVISEAKYLGTPDAAASEEAPGDPFILGRATPYQAIPETSPPQSRPDPFKRVPPPKFAAPDSSPEMNSHVPDETTEQALPKEPMPGELVKPAAYQNTWAGDCIEVLPRSLGDVAASVPVTAGGDDKPLNVPGYKNVYLYGDGDHFILEYVPDNAHGQRQVLQLEACVDDEAGITPEQAEANAKMEAAALLDNCDMSLLRVTWK